MCLIIIAMRSEYDLLQHLLLYLMRVLKIQKYTNHKYG